MAKRQIDIRRAFVIFKESVAFRRVLSFLQDKLQSIVLTPFFFWYNFSDEKLKKKDTKRIVQKDTIYNMHHWKMLENWDQFYSCLI